MTPEEARAAAALLATMLAPYALIVNTTKDRVAAAMVPHSELVTLTSIGLVDARRRVRRLRPPLAVRALFCCILALIAVVAAVGGVLPHLGLSRPFSVAHAVVGVLALFWIGAGVWEAKQLLAVERYRRLLDQMLP